MAKASKEGWAHTYRYGSEEEKEKSVEHRRAMELKGMTKLMAEMAPLLGDGFTAKMQGDGFGGTMIEVTLDGVERRDVTVKFRYEDIGYQKGRCKGITVSGDGDWGGIERLGRAYGFDFEAMTLKPATMKKVVGAITDHLTRFKHKAEQEAKHRAGADDMAAQAKAILEPLGYTVKAKGEGSHVYLDVARGDKKVIGLKTSATGYSQAKVRGYGGIDVWAKPGNLAVVVQAVENLMLAMKEE